MKTNRTGLWILLAIALVGTVLLWRLVGPTVHAPEGKYFYIRAGQRYEDVKENLEKQGILSPGLMFDMLSKWTHYTTSVRPGRYKITSGMSQLSLVRMLKHGQQSPVNFVVTKLRTKEDLAKKLADNFETDAATTAAFINNPDTMRKYHTDTNNVLSIIIPDTYTIYWNSSLSSIFQKFYAAHQRFWTPKRLQQAQELGFTDKQVYTLASIVEEETTKEADKGKIASVYINRLRKGVKLAADPTVKFAMKDFALTRIYYKYLAYPSPFNTYLVAGLPPGPICTPSPKTIDAVLNAPRTDYMFFVARPDLSGYSDFSASFAEHSRHAKAYQQALDSLARARGAGQ